MAIGNYRVIYSKREVAAVSHSCAPYYCCASWYGVASL